ncbi:MAG: DUF3570 domain-containing protein [Gammaproteobacteria bacterium]
MSRSRLAAATLGLLGVAAAAPAAAQDEPPEPPMRRWVFDTGLLLYSESDSRVQAAEPVIYATRDLGGDRKLAFKLVLDALTGATPSGATPASTPQTITQPSGRGTYTTAPDEVPLDDTFRDTRFALSGDYLAPLGDNGKVAFGLNASNEYDFFSSGANARYAHDFNQGNTTLSAGLSYEADEISPVGRVPEPLGVVPPPGGLPAGRDASDSRDVVDVLVGLTQVLDPLSLVQLNYSLSSSSGYHTDPYKILSVVDASGEPLRYVYESRPDARSKHALFARYKRFVLARDVVDASYRYLTDDWGVQSHTMDATYRWNYSGSRYLEPHLRWYTQREADFYRAALFDGEEATLQHASADPRLGAFDGITVGLAYGRADWSVRLEYYMQSGKAAGVPAQAAAGLAKFDLEPDLTALTSTFTYRFSW